MYRYAILRLTLVALISAIRIQRTVQDSKCGSAEDCGSCMRAGPTCIWCEHQNITENCLHARCYERSEISPSLCKQITDLKSENIVVSADDIGGNVQVTPQKIKLKLRPGQPQSFRLAVQPAENFPVDIYLLMDRTLSMNDDLETLKEVSSKIAPAIQSITSKYQLGFGGFTDSFTIPGITPNKISATPLLNTTAFVHYLDFTSNGTLFSEELKAIKSNTYIGFADLAEAPFYGLTQLAVCNDLVKWKPKGRSRRLVVILTDAFPKLAGEGKLGQFLEANDGKCHISKRNGKEKYFTKAEEQENPSLKQLKNILLANRITPIFAVTGDVLHIYEVIAKEWADIGASIDVLTPNSSNILQLLKDNYNKISTTVKLSDDSSSLLNFDYQVDLKSCNTSDAPNVCSNVKLNQTVYFDVNATLISCPTTKDAKEQRVTINIPGFGDVVVDVEYLCECNCTNEFNSSFCNLAGTYQCGVCDCNPGRYGCDCKCDSSLPSHNDTSSCINPRSTGDELCSSRGDCVCGECICHKKTPPKVISGEFCECENFGCDGFEGKPCGGRGVCKCGRCECDFPYKGEICDICNTFDKTKCANKDGIVCSDRGFCRCAETQSCECNCQCKFGYAGTFCETCTLSECKCNKDAIRECMTCEIENKTICDSKFSCFLYNFTKVTNDTLPNDCVIKINNCDYRINVTGDPLQKNETVSILYEFNECGKAPIILPPDDNLLTYIFAIIGGLLLLALLLLLLWKLIVTIHDKKEYEKFKEAKSSGNFEKKGNPIYKEPTLQYVNPSFTGNL